MAESTGRQSQSPHLSHTLIAQSPKEEAMAKLSITRPKMQRIE